MDRDQGPACSAGGEAPGRTQHVLQLCRMRPSMPDHNYFANLIWQIADLLRGPYRPPQYECVMLPMTVLRRFDCVLVPTKVRVLAEHVSWACIEELLRKRESRWKAPEQKLFRSVFTQKDPEAESVARGGRDEGYEPDADLRDFENVPLKDDIDAYFKREVRPHVHDAWMDRRKDKVGYEINFNRHFYHYTPPRPLEEIDAELKQAEEEIIRLLREVAS